MKLSSPLPCFSLLVASLASFAGVPSGYVTDGLTACWDAIDNLGTGVHDSSARWWVDLVGGRELQFRDNVWGEQYLQFAGNNYSYGFQRDNKAVLALFDYTDDSPDRTVELVFRYTSATTDGILLQGTAHSGIGIGRYYGGNKMIFQCNASGLTDKVLPDASFYTVSAHYKSGRIQQGTTRLKNTVAALAGAYDNWGNANDVQVTVGSRASAGTYFTGRLYAIRVYNRALSEAEATQNYNADVSRYTLATAATVVSGSVTVGGETYGAGQAIRVDADTTALAVTAASAATLKLAPRTTALTLAAGSLALAETQAGELQYLTDLTLGATADLQLPADGLDVTGTLTAEAGATVTGPGLLFATPATSPVTLAGGATYRSSAAAFAWPASGIAYIPVATTVDIDDVSKVAAVDKIVFLGSDSMLTYRLADAWTLATPVEGPGTFAFESAGDVTISADNAKLTGAFYFTNTTLQVAHRNGLGSERSQTCHFWAGGDPLVSDSIGHPITLDDGSAVLTNRVPLYLHTCLTGVSGSKKIGHPLQFGSVSLAKTLVQDADFRYECEKGGALSKFTFLNRVKFLRLFQFVAKANNPYPSWWSTKGGEVWLLGSLRCTGTGILYVETSDKLHLGLRSVFVSHNFLSYSTQYVCHHENTFGLNNVWVLGNNFCSYIDLNGYDQTVNTVGTYNGNSGGSLKTGTPLMEFTSATPASLRIGGAKSLDINTRFGGEAGFAMAKSGYTYGLYDQSGQVLNDTKGVLEAEAGTLVLGDGYKWTGTNVVVSGGTLAITNTQGLANDRIRLDVSSGAFSLRKGGSALVGYAFFGGTELADGTYTVAELKAMPAVAPYLGADSDDAATLMVYKPSEFEWEGWPETPTAVVKVPGNKTVYVGSDETNKVIQNALSINLGVNSRVVFTNMPNAALTLPMPISGKGKFEFEDCGEVTITADNSALTAPGAFKFTRTSVIAAHRYALGCADTAACTHTCTAGSSTPGNRFRFDPRAKTNDVALVLDGAHFVGCTASDGAIVLNGAFTLVNSVPAADKRPSYIGDITFNGVTTTRVLDGDANTVLRFPATEAFTAEYGTLFMYGAPGPGHIHFRGATPSSRISGLVLQFGFVIDLWAEGAFQLTSEGVTTWGSGTIDLHGFDQTVSLIAYAGGNDTYLTDKDPVVFTSETPATLYMANNYKYVSNRSFALKGAVSLDYSGTQTQKMGAGYNDTTGSLTVRSGRLEVANGSYWGGSDVTITGGTLAITNCARVAESGDGAFFSSTAALTMTSAGALEIAADRVDTVLTFNLDGAFLPAGTYGGANTPASAGLDSAHKLDVLIGKGLLRVRRNTDQPGFVIFFH